MSVFRSPVLSVAGKTGAVALVYPDINGGAPIAHVADNGVGGGNARGANAVDWQTARGAAAQVASGAQAVLVGGDSNTASGTLSAVLGGTGNIASASRTVIGGGASNTADATYATIPGGQYAATRGTIGKFAFASGRLASNGDAQLGEHVLRRQTTDATATRLTSDGGAAGAANSINLPNNGTFCVRLMLAARQIGGSAGTAGDSAVWYVDALVKRGANAAATAVYGGAAAAGPNFYDAAAAGWTLTVAADTTNGALAVTVAGEANKSINWVARVPSVESVG